MSSYQGLQESGGKNCQTSNMQSVKSAMDMWSVTNTKYKRAWSDKNCQERWNKKKNPMKQMKSMCFVRKCQVNM